jgi:hypothetical protein
LLPAPAAKMNLAAAILICEPRRKRLHLGMPCNTAGCMQDEKQAWNGWALKILQHSPQKPEKIGILKVCPLRYFF